MQKSLPKEKVVQIYEKFFLGQDITQGRADFWGEFFLLKVNIKVLCAFFERISQDQLTNLKPHLNRLYGECLSQADDNSHWLRVANALQTADCLVLGVFTLKDVSLPPEARLDLLLPSESLRLPRKNFVELCSRSISENWPDLLQEIILNSITVLTVASDNITENPFYEWLLEDSVYQLLTSLIATPAFRFRLGPYACRILGILAQRRSEAEVKNLFAARLAHVDDELLLNAISAVASFVLSTSCRKYSEQIQAGNGILSSISNLLGNLKVGDGQRQSFGLHDGLLLYLSEIVRANPRFPALFTCSHTHSDPSPASADALSHSNAALDSTAGSGEPTTLAPELHNLLADLIEYVSIVMQDIKGVSTFNTCALCFKIISNVTKHPSACSFLYEFNIYFALRLHRVRLRHRKPSALLQDRSSNNTMAAILLDLLVEFLSTHLMKFFPFEIYGHCLDTCFHLLSHQKEHNIRLDYDWRQLWKALFDLSRFVVKIARPSDSCLKVLALLRKTVGVFNFFITCGDGFLQGPDVYDELYYELIRMASVVEGINEFCHQTSTSSDAQLKSMANELLLDSSNMRAIVKHFEAKINAYASRSNLASLTEAQVYEVIRENYDALTLRVFEDLHTHFALPIPDAVQSEKNALLEMVQQMRRCCLDASVGFQSRFAELSVIR
ncbi:hypothetical protein AAHC03_02029 [Spirometra sp. Aus1]